MIDEMNVTAARWRSPPTDDPTFRIIACHINGQELDVPDNMDNRHRQMIAEWEEEGNTIEPYVEPEKGYEELRRGEYPPMGDQFDDLFHQGSFSDEMAATLQAVKDKYPKPE